MIYIRNIIVVVFSVICIFSCKRKNDEILLSNARINELIEKSYIDSLDIKLKQHYLDSAFNELEEYRNDSVTRYFYRKGSAAYYNLKLYNNAIIAADKTLEKSIEAKDSASIARAFYYKADAYYGKGQLTEAFSFYSQAEKMYNKINDFGTLGEVLLYKAYIYYDVGEYSLCETAAIRALTLLSNENKVIHVYNCNNLIATALDGLDDNEGALKYYNYGLNELDKFKNQGFTDSDIALYKASCYNNMGGVYVKMGLHDEAIKLYNSALYNKNVKEEQPPLYAKLLNNLAYAKFKSGDDSGLPQLFYKSLTLRQELRNKSGIVASQIYLGEYFMAKKDTARAISYLKSAYAGASEINSNVEILNSLRLLSQIDVANARSYFEKRYQIDTKLKQTAERNRDKFARIEYETDKLELEKQQLAETNNLIVIVSAVSLLLIAAFFMIYYLNARNKKLLLIQEQQRANEEIYQLMFDQQQKIDTARNEEKSRIAMELHDGILNNIYAVRLNLEFINKKTDDESVNKRKEFIRELQNVESEIRGVSHDLSRNSIFSNEKTFKALLEFMVNSQKNNAGTAFETDIDPMIDWDEYNNIIKTNIYRIIQEAIQNINKYSMAKNAKISIKAESGVISMGIKDDGVGFDTEKVKSTGIGMKNLKKRVSALSGTLTITSAPGKGTSVLVSFPAI